MSVWLKVDIGVPYSCCRGRGVSGCVCSLSVCGVCNVSFCGCSCWLVGVPGTSCKSGWVYQILHLGLARCVTFVLAPIFLKCFASLLRIFSPCTAIICVPCTTVTLYGLVSYRLLSLDSFWSRRDPISHVYVVWFRISFVVFVLLFGDVMPFFNCCWLVLLNLVVWFGLFCGVFPVLEWLVLLYCLRNLYIYCLKHFPSILAVALYRFHKVFS